MSGGVRRTDHGDVQTTERPRRVGPVFVLDVAIGASSLAAGTTLALGRRAGRLAGAALRLRPRVAVDSWLVELADRGERQQDLAKTRLSSLGDEVLGAVLSRIDLTGTVRRYVDVNSIVGDVDLDAVVERLDLAGMAEGVIAEIDLGEIIRQSTGALTSDTVQAARMQGIAGDEAVDRATGRIRLRFSRKPVPAAPTEP